MCELVLVIQPPKPQIADTIPYFEWPVIPLIKFNSDKIGCLVLHWLTSLWGKLAVGLNEWSENPSHYPIWGKDISKEPVVVAIINQLWMPVISVL